MGLFGSSKKSTPELDRESSLNARPVLNQLIKTERGQNEHIVLIVPRKKTSLVKAVSGFFKLPLTKQIALDEVGSYVVELCDGTNTVKGMITKLSQKYRLSRREAEVSMLSFLRQLGRRGIIGFVIEEDRSEETNRR